jgi:hypothetical protein
MKGHPLRFVSRLSLGCLIAVSLLWQATPDDFAKAPSSKEAMVFAADMAERGNWREASFRWKRVMEQAGPDAKILNNLAVAAEAGGEMEQAGEYYAQALELAGGDPAIGENYRRFNRLRELLAERDDADRQDTAFAIPIPSNTNKTKGKAVRISVPVPIPPRLDLEGLETLLVASFLANQSTLLDVDREIARFLRGEFRQRTRLEVLDVVPPPAIPEQTIEDLIKNHEFWKHLGREYDADLIVSGVVSYGREEVSGFEDVDIVNPSTGQKVRETRFVEQEEFAYVLDLLFMDGTTGGLLFRDRLRRAVRYRGLMNDPIHAFYELGESLSDDIVSVVSTRMRVETRSIFKK